MVPAHVAFSVDRGRVGGTVPAWALWLLRVQVGIPYFYAGLAKLNHDWLRGEPMRMWLAGRADMPLIGSFLGREWVVLLFAYGGLLFDLAAQRRTLRPAHWITPLTEDLPPR